MNESVFVSYARNDANKVLPIKDKIENVIGRRCWIDLTGIESDQQFVDTIIAAIKACDIFLFMYSAASSKSQWARKELDFAEDEKKRIVFVKIDDTELTDWFRFNYARRDIIDYNVKEQRNKLFANLKEWCKDKPNYVESRGAEEVDSLRAERERLVRFRIQAILLVCMAILLICGFYQYYLKKDFTVDSIEVLKSVSSDAMAVDLGRKELARTTNGIPDKIVQYEAYTASYNQDWKIPNWVTYSLSADKLEGRVRRSMSPPEQEPLLDNDSVSNADYTNSGYDRGHLAASGDMKWSITAQKDCNYLCNRCPQTSALNAGLWEKLEQKVRGLAKEYEIFICCGPIVEKNHKMINGKIAVPSSFFKVLCMKRKGKWIGIGFILDNVDNFPSQNLADYAVSIDEIEKRTGHTFFYNIEALTQNDFKTHFDLSEWTIR